MDLDNVSGIHLDIPYETDDIEDASLVYMGEQEKGEHTYLLELETTEDGTQRYQANLDVDPVLVEEAALMDDQFTGGVEEAGTYTDVDLDDVEHLN